MKILLKLRRI